MPPPGLGYTVGLSISNGNSQFYHLVNDKGNHREVKHSRRPVEMKGQFNTILKFSMELELIQLDCDGVRFGICCNFSTPQISLKR